MSESKQVTIESDPIINRVYFIAGNRVIAVSKRKTNGDSE